MIDTEKKIDHEVRIRLLEKIADSIIRRFVHLEDKIDNHFNWIIAIMIGLFGGLLITKLF
jgi:hypothetical protein